MTARQIDTVEQPAAIALPLLGRSGTQRVLVAVLGAAIVVAGAVIADLISLASGLVIVLIVGVCAAIIAASADAPDDDADLGGRDLLAELDRHVPMMVAVGNTIVRHNRAFGDLLLIGDRSIAGRPMSEFVDHQRTTSLKRSTQATRGSGAVLIVWRRDDGTAVVTECRGVEMDRRGRATWTCVDVTATIERQPDAAALSLRDDSTGLLTRQGLLDRFDDCFVGSHILTVELDEVERLSAVIGREPAEELVAHIGNRVLAIVGDRGPVCRYDNNQLVIVLPMPADEQTAAVIAAEVAAATREVVLLGTGAIVTDLPVGRAVLALEDSLATVVHRARERSIAA